jgi:SAM-dependent methyltransferase
VRLLETFLRRYARAQARDVGPFLVGRRVLDLGAGEGHVTARLRRGGPWACGVDVGAFRREDGPYVAYDGKRLPFPDRAFDTTLLLLTLHHCQAPELVLDEAVRVTRRRLIVTESVYRNRLDHFWLVHLDRWLNRLRHAGRMAVPLAFRPADGWQALFDARGLRLVTTGWLGSRWERLVHHPRLYVLDVPGGHRAAR